MKTVEQIFEELIATMEKNAIDNKVEITNVKLWASSWREELQQQQVRGSVPHRCPICLGSGLVSGGFYNSVNGAGSTSSMISEQCRQCEGKGIIII